MSFAGKRNPSDPSMSTKMAVARRKGDQLRKERAAALGRASGGGNGTAAGAPMKPGAAAAKRLGLLSGSERAQAGGGKPKPKPGKKAVKKAGTEGGKNPGQKKKKNKVKLPSLVAGALPINLADERAAFFASNCERNPYFRYNDSGYGQTRANKRYGVADQRLMPLAQQILDQTLAEFGSEAAYLEKNFGERLSIEQVDERVHSYLASQGLDSAISVNYIENAASPTSMGDHHLNIRIPCTYRTWRIEGTLSHEIGTHFTRRSNDELQPWHGKRKKWRLRPFLETEEGLATLNNVLHEAVASDAHAMSWPHKPGQWTGLDWSSQPGGRPGGTAGLRPLLWQAALHYWSAGRAAELPFVELYKELGQYLGDADTRWRQCVRVFRGTRDTGVAEACMCKDQVYLAGAVDILANRRHIAMDWTLLFAGRLALADVLERGTELRNAEAKTGPTVLREARGLPRMYTARVSSSFLAGLRPGPDCRVPRPAGV